MNELDSLSTFTGQVLELLRLAGLPVAIVATLGMAIAAVQFAAGVRESVDRTEASAISLFARSPRRVRAAGLFLISHAFAVTVTVATATLLLARPEVTNVLNISETAVLMRLQAGVAAYFLVIDWWALNRGDTLPEWAAFVVGTMGSFGILLLALTEAVRAENWAPLVPWAVTAYVWFRAVAWASSTGSGLARALQNP